MTATATAPRELDAFSWGIGIIEGEGWIGLVRRSEHVGMYNYPRVSVQSTDYDTVIRLRDAFNCGRVSGPRVPKDGVRKPSWTWSASGYAARELLAGILPHLGERRRARAIEVLNEPALRQIAAQLSLAETA